MTYPILEHDPTREAFIEPSNFNQPRDVPERCVICFFQDVIDKVVAQHGATTLAGHGWEDGQWPLHEIRYKDQRLAFFNPGVGAAHAVGILEEVIAWGCRKFIACGGCGVLDQDIVLGGLVVVSAAVRDEGVSYHYLPPAREVVADESGVTALVETLEDQGVPHRVGKVWTTDAPYRETPDIIARRRAEGCLVVEMEAAGMMAVAAFRDVVFGQVLYGGDDLTGVEWDSRNWQSQVDVRERLFWLAADACLAL
jgi:uridine phosphorylase